MKVYLIRHGKTAGNLEKRYIGVTDEPLCPEGVAELREKRYPECELVVTSPMKRCVETARIIYPDKELVICPDLAECDFGDFEGKNYIKLSENADYQGWIDSGGTLPFPNGESPEDFKARCVRGFDDTVSRYSQHGTLAFVVHGGTIMAIMERYGGRGFYYYQAANACGFSALFDGKKLRATERI